MVDNKVKTTPTRLANRTIFDNCDNFESQFFIVKILSFKKGVISTLRTNKLQIIKFKLN